MMLKGLLRRGGVTQNLEEMVQIWCFEQLSYWRGLRLDYKSTADQLHELSSINPSLILFEFKGGFVGIVQKDNGSRDNDTIELRASAYKNFLQKVVDLYGLQIDGILAMELHDGAFSSTSIPTFAFQKPRGSVAILINDIDAILNQFYLSSQFQDELDFASKATTAIFAGATTGDLHTVESIASLSNRRLRSAAYFQPIEDVDFRLPMIVQCLDQRAIDAIKQLNFGTEYAPWGDQLKNKFLISMDGNGATCSRVAIALKSNSVLMKYNSDNLLYYFSALQPWKHFVPINSDIEVEPLIEIEKREPGSYKDIAIRSSQFYDQYMSVEASLYYAAQILDGYFKCFAY